jgi:hypothetical protein
MFNWISSNLKVESQEVELLETVGDKFVTPVQTLRILLLITILNIMIIQTAKTKKRGRPPLTEDQKEKNAPKKAATKAAKREYKIRLKLEYQIGILEYQIIRTRNRVFF